jgi:hypothetical protein
LAGGLGFEDAASTYARRARDALSVGRAHVPEGALAAQAGTPVRPAFPSGAVGDARAGGVGVADARVAEVGATVARALTVLVTLTRRRRIDGATAPHARVARRTLPRRQADVTGTAVPAAPEAAVGPALPSRAIGDARADAQARAHAGHTHVGAAVPMRLARLVALTGGRVVEGATASDARVAGQALPVDTHGCASAVAATSAASVVATDASIAAGCAVLLEETDLVVHAVHAVRTGFAALTEQDASLDREVTFDLRSTARGVGTVVVGITGRGATAGSPPIEDPGEARFARRARPRASVHAVAVAAGDEARRRGAAGRGHGRGHPRQRRRG